MPNVTKINGYDLKDDISGYITVNDIPTASTTTKGAVKVDGTTITIANGVISSKGGIAYEVIETWED